MRLYPQTVFTVRACKNPSARMQPSVRTDALITSLPSPPLPHPLRTRSAVHTNADADTRKIITIIKKIGSCCQLRKREKKFRFSVFNPRDPRAPRARRAWRALRAKPREEEGFFGLVPLVTHPSSIPLLGGLTPKFLSLSLHSL
jgi:hypothetical protein